MRLTLLHERKASTKSQHIGSRRSWREESRGERDKGYELDKVVGGTSQNERSRNGRQVPIDLVVGPPEEWEEQEDFAGVEGTGDFADEGIIPGDVPRLCPVEVARRLWRVPESWFLELGEGLDWVPRGSLMTSNPEDTKHYSFVSKISIHNTELVCMLPTSRMMDPRGGVIMYLFLPYNKTRGIRRKIPVGTRKVVR